MGISWVLTLVVLESLGELGKKHGGPGPTLLQ